MKHTFFSSERKTNNDTCLAEWYRLRGAKREDQKQPMQRFQRHGETASCVQVLVSKGYEMRCCKKKAWK